MLTTGLVAAATDKSARLPGDVLPWLILLIGLILIGGAVIYFIRRWMRQDSSSAHAVGFTLQDLRDMHARGELTDEEFVTARAKMIGRLTAGTSLEAGHVEGSKSSPGVEGGSVSPGSESRGTNNHKQSSE